MKKFQMAVTIFCAILSFSCLGPNKENNDSGSDIGSTSDPEKGIASFFGDDTKTHAFKDAKTGISVYSIDYPSSWKVAYKPTYESDGDFPNFLYRIQGPGKLKMFNDPLKNYSFFSNPQMAQLSRMNGNGHGATHRTGH